MEDYEEKKSQNKSYEQPRENQESKDRDSKGNLAKKLGRPSVLPRNIVWE